MPHQLLFGPHHLLVDHKHEFKSSVIIKRTINKVFFLSSYRVNAKIRHLWFWNILKTFEIHENWWYIWEVNVQAFQVNLTIEEQLHLQH